MKFCPNLAEKTKPLRSPSKEGERLDLGYGSTRRLPAAESGHGIRASPCTVWSRKGDYSIIWCKQLRVGCSPYAEATSRSMTETERRYAQIEKEALAITWALEHWADFLIGMKFKVETDHKPLIPLLSTKLIDELPIRIQRFRMRLMGFDFTIHHVSGKILYTSDSLSRSPL